MAIHDWELLRVLLETTRAGSLRKAETVLGLTQPTIGKKIDRLEQMVRAKVLYRTKAGVSLTPAGANLYNVAEEMEGLTLRASKRIDHGKIELSGNLRLAVTDGMAAYWMPQRLRRFHREHPHVTLDIRVIEAGTEVNLSEREADITIMYRPPTDPDVVVLQKAAMVLAPVCTKEFIEDWGEPKTMEDMLNFPVAAHYAHFRKEGDMKPWAEMLERHTMVMCRTASSIVLGNVTRMGICVSLQPIGVLDREEVAVMLDIDGFRSYLPFYLVCHREVKDIPIVRVLIHYLGMNLFKDESPGGPTRKLDGVV